MRQNIKTFALLISIAIGIIFHKYISVLNPILPYLLFMMIFLTFCKIGIKDLKFSKLNIYLLIYQIVVSYGAYFLLRGFNEVIAQGVMSCILAPTACAAVVVAGTLGASVATVATYTLLCNLAVAVFAPLLFTIINGTDISIFFHSVYLILLKIFPILVLPMIVAFLLRWILPKVTTFFSGISNLSFYLWAVTVTIVIARTTSFIVNQTNPNYKVEILLAVISGLLCVLQFYLGRKLGRKYGDAVAGGQSLGQKNSALMIWLVQTFLNPIASVACAAYVIWQNIVNSYQLWQKSKGNSNIKGSR